MQKTERNHGIDLLKIILAIMVIIIHINAGGTGQVLLNATEFPWNWIISFVTILCYPAVNTYILICGYYSYSVHKDVKSIIQSLSSLWLSALFFSFVGYFVSVIWFGKQILINEFVKRFFPITRGVWWFYTVYFALMLISPFVNKMLDNLSNVEIKLLIVLLVLFFSIFPVFVDWKGQLGSNYGYSLIWFVTLYLVGAFLNLIDIGKIKTNYSWGVFLLLSIIMLFWPKAFGLVGINSTVSMYNSLFCLGQSICLFCLFVRIQIPQIGISLVGSISNVILASYLLHCQEDIEIIMWEYIHPSSYANSISIVFVTFYIVAGILLTSIVLEQIRKKVCKLLRVDKVMSQILAVVFKYAERVLQK